MGLEMLSNRALPVLLLLSSQVGVGCTQGAESSTQAEISDSAGTRIVLNRTPRWIEGETWAVSPEPTVRIGVLDGPEEYQLVDVAAAARRSDGTYVVADRGSKTVRLYDSDGTFLQTLGGAGSGPGEFTDPGPILLTGGDTLVVWDQALLRVTRFDRDGELAEIRAVDWGRLFNRLGMEPAAGKAAVAKKGEAIVYGLFPGPMEPLGDGSLLVRLVGKTDEVPSEGYHRRKSGALRISSDFSSVDTLMFFGDTEQFAVDAPWGQYAVVPPSAKRTRIAHGGRPPKICIGEQEGPEIVCFESDGGRTLMRWTIEPPTLTDAEVAQWREEMVQEYDLKLSRDQVLEVLDQVPIPPRRPPYSQIILDAGGHLWAELGPATGNRRGSTDFLVFDLRGVLLGTVALPPMRVLEIGPDYVLGVLVDELGIEYVRVHELDRRLTGVG